MLPREPLAALVLPSALPAAPVLQSPGAAYTLMIRVESHPDPTLTQRKGGYTMAETIQEPQETYTDSQYLMDTAGFLHTLSSILFLELTQTQIDALKDLDWAQMATDDMSPEMASGYKGIGRYLARSGANVRQDLAVEYARIFLGAGVSEEQLAVPFESVFTSPEGIMMQDSRDDVVRVFRSQGMAVDKDLNVPEDHISFELDFLAFMAERTAAALDAQDGSATKDSEDPATATIQADATNQAADLISVQVSFIENHLLNWIDPLMERVEACALSPFYPSVMKVLKSTLTEYKAALQEM